MICICNVKACKEIDVFKLTGEVQIAEKAPSVKFVVKLALLHMIAAGDGEVGLPTVDAKSFIPSSLSFNEA